MDGFASAYLEPSLWSALAGRNQANARSSIESASSTSPEPPSRQVLRPDLPVTPPALVPQC